MEQDLSQLAKKIEEIGPDGLASVLRLLDVGVGCTSAQTVEEFLADNRISRATFYVEVNSGRLRTFKVGARRLVSRESAADWRRRLEEATAKEAAP